MPQTHCPVQSCSLTSCSTTRLLSAAIFAEAIEPSGVHPQFDPFATLAITVMATQHLRKLVLSDFGVLFPSDTEQDAKWGEQCPVHSAETAYDRMVHNVGVLSHLGAQTDGSVPFNKVSGFPREDGDGPDIRNPAEMFPEKKLRLLIWGSPHPNPSCNDGVIHGSKAVSAQYKTQAFESMAWLCPTGVVAMTFPAKYEVEFYQPCSDPTAANRVLVCCRMHSRSYVPMASSNGLRYTIPDTSIDDVMVALLVPPSFMRCLAFAKDRLDFGWTMRNVLELIGEDEYGCALGVYDCSLEMELAFVNVDFDSSTDDDYSSNEEEKEY